MNAQKKLTLTLCCLFCTIKIQAQPSMRFMNNDTLIISQNDHLEILDARKNCHHAYTTLPKDGIFCTSPHCDIFCSNEEIFVVSNTAYNTLWKLNFTNKSWNPIFITGSSTSPTKFNEGIKIYSSPNGKHFVCIGYKQKTGKTSSCAEMTHHEQIVCNLNSIGKNNWRDSYDIQISNDGKIMLFLSYQNSPMLIKEKSNPATLSSLLRCGEITQAKLSAQGNYVLLMSNEFLAILNTNTLEISHILRLNKKNNLTIFPWNPKMKQFINFSSPNEFFSAFKHCENHARYDTCADRFDTIGTPFCNFNTIFAEFSDDENRLLLITQTAKPFEQNKETTMQVIDLKKMNLIWKNTSSEVKVQAAAISPNGSLIAILDQDDEIAVKDLNV